MTLAGTNTYVVGHSPAYVIDPGPDDPRHLDGVRAEGERRGGIGGVLLTHSHLDHSEGVEGLGAPLLWGERGSSDEAAELEAAARGEARTGGGGPGPAAEAGAPTGVAGSAGVARSDAVAGEPLARAGPLEVLPTPGHAPDHVCFLLGLTCFCGDLVLGEGSSIVPPGGGSLAAYLDSLARLRDLDPDLLCPGHGPWITEPAAKLTEYREHRLERERRLLAALEAGERSRERLLDAVWDDVPAALRPAAALAMEAHLEKLGAEGRLPAGLSP